MHCWRIMKANPVLPNEHSKKNSPQQNEISRPPNHYRNCDVNAGRVLIIRNRIFHYAPRRHE